MKIVVVLFFGLIFLDCSLLGMSEKQKIIAIADIWNNVNKRSVSVTRYHDDKPIDWNVNNYGWEIELLSDDMYYNGVVLARYNCKTKEKEIVGCIENFYRQFNCCPVYMYNCFRNNAYFMILPVVEKKYLDKEPEAHVRLCLFKLPLQDFDNTRPLLFVADLGVFQGIQQCDISEDSSQIRVQLDDNRVHVTSIKVPSELRFE